MVKHTQTIRRLLLTNCLSVFDQFVGLPLEGLTSSFFISFLNFNEIFFSQTFLVYIMIIKVFVYIFLGS